MREPPRWPMIAYAGGRANSRPFYSTLLVQYTVDICRKHQVFESATLAANNPPAKEPPGSRKQPLKTVVVPSSATDGEL